MISYFFLGLTTIHLWVAPGSLYNRWGNSLFSLWKTKFSSTCVQQLIIRYVIILNWFSLLWKKRGDRSIVDLLNHTRIDDVILNKLTVFFFNICDENVTMQNGNIFLFVLDNFFLSFRDIPRWWNINTFDDELEAFDSFNFFGREWLPSLRHHHKKSEEIANFIYLFFSSFFLLALALKARPAATLTSSCGREKNTPDNER